MVDVVAIVPPLRSEPLFDDFGHLTIRAAEYFERSATGLQELFDSVEAIELRLDLVEARLDAVELRLTLLEGTFIVTAVDFTTTGNQTVVCTAEVTITLTLNPVDKDLVRIKQRATKVTIDGNGRNIEGETSVILRKRQTALKSGIGFIYSSELDEWFAI